MQLTFLGATGTVTGSRYLVRHGDTELLVDCGLFQGFKPLRLRNWAPLPLDASRLSAVILTHAHLDHSGALPLLVRQGFRGPIHCTRATYELCRLLLADSAHLQEEQAEHANRHGYSKHSPALPLYTAEDAEAALRLFAPVDYASEWQPAPGIAAALAPSGHILGGSFVTLRANGRRLVFSGDLGRPNDLLMPPPSALGEADVLVLESTYGDRRHPPVDPVESLARVVSRTVSRGGVAVVPSFAVGRAQALLYLMHLVKASGGVPDVLPVYLDSPMAADVSEIYVRHRREHRLTAQQCSEMSRAARFVNSPEESRRLDERTFPMVIIAGSGMATGGRVLHHLKRFAPDPRTTILLTGFQAGGTRGAALLAGARAIKIHGEMVPVAAEVASLEGLSAHADWAETLDWLATFRRMPHRIFLTHGEPAAADALRLHIADRFRFDATIPDYRETVDLE